MLKFRFRSGLLAAIGLTVFLTACGGGGGSSPTPTPPGTPVTVAISVLAPYTDTGVSVTAGEVVSITGSGTINYRGGCGTACNTTPAGNPWTTCANNPNGPFTAPGLPCYSLIGKVGSAGSAFEVGTSLLLTAPASGELFLGVNDNFYPDNQGGFTAKIVPQ